MVPVEYLTTCVSLPKYWASRATFAEKNQTFSMPIPIAQVCSSLFLDCLANSDLGDKINERKDSIEVEALLLKRKEEVQATKTEDRKQTADDFNRGGIHALPTKVSGQQLVAKARAARASSVAQLPLPMVSVSDGAFLDQKFEEIRQIATLARNAAEVTGPISASVSTFPSFHDLYKAGKVPLNPQQELHASIIKKNNLHVIPSRQNDAFKAATIAFRIKCEAKLGYILAICPQEWDKTANPLMHYEAPPFKPHAALLNKLAPMEQEPSHDTTISDSDSSGSEDELVVQDLHLRKRKPSSECESQGAAGVANGVLHNGPSSLENSSDTDDKG